MKPGNERPVDKTAALVVGRGESYEFKMPPNSSDSEQPLPVKAPQWQHWNDKHFVDFTGRKFGWLTVLGLSATKAKRWVCRCNCGRYCLRLTATIRAEVPDASCDQCNQLLQAKRYELIRRTGREVSTTELMK